jgi:hypothetical protein
VKKNLKELLIFLKTRSKKDKIFQEKSKKGVYICPKKRYSISNKIRKKDTMTYSFTKSILSDETLLKNLRRIIQLNNTPRKSLGGLTPVQYAAQERVKIATDKYGYYSKHPDWILLGDESNWKAYHKSTDEAKQILADLKQEKENIEQAEFIAENKESLIFEGLLEFDIVTKIQIRQAMDQYGWFTPERLQKMIGDLEKEGVKIK